MNNIMPVLEGEKNHTSMAAVTQVIKVLSIQSDMTFEEMIDDLIMIHDVLYANVKLERVEGK